jgi:nuclear receptor co-repressor 1
LSIFAAGNQLKLVPTSEMIKYTSQLLSESKHEIHRSTLKMPALILDQKDKMYTMFLSSNGLVEDPVAIEKERVMINPWTAEEKEIFLEKFAAYGKDFRKIATFLDHKTTADCVEFYYKNHKSDCFEKIKKKDDDKLGKFFKAKTDLIASGVKCNSEVNASSLDILSEASSVMADDIARDRKMRSGSSLWRGYNNKAMSRCDNIITERSDSFDILQDERETVAADVLASICGCLLSEATSSCITSSVDPVKGKRVVKKCVKAKPLSKKPPMPDITQNIDHETCSDESCGEMELTDWSDVEKAAFLHAVSLFGKDFAMIAQRVRTRSQYQCKVFFSKTQKRLRLNRMGQRSENVGSLVNDGVDGARSDADNACVVETGSANGSDSSGTKTAVDQPASDKNMYHDESNPVEASNLSADLYKSEEINRKVDHEDVDMVSNACVIGSESKLCTDGNVGVLNGSDRSGSVREQRAIVMSDSTEIGKNEPSEGGGAVTELVSGMGTMEPCCSNSIAEGRLVSDVSSAQRGNELEGSTICLVDRDEADTDVVIELKGNVHDSSTLVNTSLSSVDVSCQRLSVEAENEPQLCLEKPQFSGSSEGPLSNATSTLQYSGAAVQYKKTSSQDLPSCDFQGNQDMTRHNCSSNLGHQPCTSENSLDHVEAARVLQCYNLQAPSEKEVNVNMSCSSSATELPLLSQKIDLEESPRNDVKIFGKILTNPSSTLGVKENEENGTHHPKLSSGSSCLKLTGHDNNTGGKSTILNVDLNDCRVFENVPVGNKMQPVFSSLPDSAILLAKYPAAFGSYGLEAVSSLPLQVTKMSTSNGIGEPGILAGGSTTIVDQFVGQTGSAIKEDEPVGEKKDLNS